MDILNEKSFKFVVQIVKLYHFLVEDKKEFVLSKQILRSGTSVGALQREASQAESKADFVHKYAIAQKEWFETMYWLELLLNTEYISKSQYDSLYFDAEELMKLIISSIKTAKKPLTANH